MAPDTNIDIQKFWVFGQLGYAKNEVEKDPWIHEKNEIVKKNDFVFCFIETTLEKKLTIENIPYFSFS